MTNTRKSLNPTVSLGRRWPYGKLTCLKFPLPAEFSHRHIVNNTRFLLHGKVMKMNNSLTFIKFYYAAPFDLVRTESSYYSNLFV